MIWNFFFTKKIISRPSFSPLSWQSLQVQWIRRGWGHKCSLQHYLGTGKGSTGDGLHHRVGDLVPGLLQTSFRTEWQRTLDEYSNGRQSPQVVRGQKNLFVVWDTVLLQTQPQERTLGCHVVKWWKSIRFPNTSDVLEIFRVLWKLCMVYLVHALFVIIMCQFFVLVLVHLISRHTGWCRVHRYRHTHSSRTHWWTHDRHRNLNNWTWLPGNFWSSRNLLDLQRRFDLNHVCFQVLS